MDKYYDMLQNIKDDICEFYVGGRNVGKTEWLKQCSSNRVECISKLLNEYYSDVTITTDIDLITPDCYFIFEDRHPSIKKARITIPCDVIISHSIIDSCNHLIREYRNLYVVNHTNPPLKESRGKILCHR